MCPCRRWQSASRTLSSRLHPGEIWRRNWTVWMTEGSSSVPWLPLSSVRVRTASLYAANFTSRTVLACSSILSVSCGEKSSSKCFIAWAGVAAKASAKSCIISCIRPPKKKYAAARSKSRPKAVSSLQLLSADKPLRTLLQMATHSSNLLFLKR